MSRRHYLLKSCFAVALTVALGWLSYLAGRHMYLVVVAEAKTVQLPANGVPLSAAYALIPLPVSFDSFENGSRVDIYGRDSNGQRQILVVDALVVDNKRTPPVPGFKTPPDVIYPEQVIMIPRERMIMLNGHCDLEGRPTAVVGPPAYSDLLSPAPNAPKQGPVIVAAGQQ